MADVLSFPLNESRVGCTRATKATVQTKRIPPFEREQNFEKSSQRKEYSFGVLHVVTAPRSPRGVVLIARSPPVDGWPPGAGRCEPGPAAPWPRTDC